MAYNHTQRTLCLFRMNKCGNRDISKCVFIFFRFIFPHCRLLIRIHTLKPTTLLSNTYCVYPPLSIYIISANITRNCVFSVFFCPLPLDACARFLFFQPKLSAVVYTHSGESRLKDSTSFLFSYVGFVTVRVRNFDPFFSLAHCHFVYYCLFARECSAHKRGQRECRVAEYSNLI